MIFRNVDSSLIDHAAQRDVRGPERHSHYRHNRQCGNSYAAADAERRACSNASPFQLETFTRGRANTSDVARAGLYCTEHAKAKSAVLTAARVLASKSPKG